MIGFVTPKNLDMSDIINRFDLYDPKETWDGSFNNIHIIQTPVGDSFIYEYGYIYSVEVSIVFRQLKDGATFPELERKHFDLLLFIRHIRIFEPSGSQLRYRAYLDITSRDLEIAIRHLESLDFVKSARPINLLAIPDFWWR